jgi:hypothetical protein
MAGASIEATLELWAQSLRDVKGRIRPLFTQQRVAVSAERFLDGLLGEVDLPRKSGEHFGQFIASFSNCAGLDGGTDHGGGAEVLPP